MEPVGRRHNPEQWQHDLACTAIQIHPVGTLQEAPSCTLQQHAHPKFMCLAGHSDSGPPTAEACWICIGQEHLYPSGCWTSFLVFCCSGKAINHTQWQVELYHMDVPESRVSVSQLASHRAGCKGGVQSSILNKHAIQGV